MRGGGNIRIQPDIDDVVFGQALFVQLVLTSENSPVFGFKEDVGGVCGDGDDSTVKIDAEKFFEMVLGFDKVVLIHLEKGVVDGVA